ncbi:SlyX family protein [Oceaniradius stylonematis]|jgi:SlyX protein|uniref:SlyX family protein n=2 Tax=Oceaniradius stylonematis TaxID=2184161 RepID=A0A3A8ABK0_9HYPH|nr:SlyX family protein [Oceaniradius stylonematis]RNC96589.1 MAG: SlyX family protein [Oricola sp.]
MLALTAHTGPPMAKTDTERLDDLEILAAHQAQMIDDLNEVVVSQGEVIADLRRKLEVLARRFSEAEERMREAVPVDKPPHW